MTEHAGLAQGQARVARRKPTSSSKIPHLPFTPCLHPASSSTSDPSDLPPRASRLAIKQKRQLRAGARASGASSTPFAAPPFAAPAIAATRAVVAAAAAVAAVAAVRRPAADPPSPRRYRGPGRVGRVNLGPSCGHVSAVGERMMQASEPRPCDRVLR
jgi:hypothetical protein